MTRLTDFRVLSFDCYGTLIDWETGLLEALQPLLDQLDQQLPRAQILEAFARQETALEAEHPSMPYSELLERVYGLATEWHLDTTNGPVDPVGRVSGPTNLGLAFGSSIGDWPAFPDSTEALQSLQRQFKLVILSNVDRRSFARSQQRLGVEFDYVFTAEEIGSYKPSLRNFEYMLERLSDAGYGKDDILHTAQSLFHDHAPAQRVGLHSVWINRQKGRPGATLPPDPMPHFDFEFDTLRHMADKAQAEVERG